MRTISEILAAAGRKVVKCPFSRAGQHDLACVCKGTGKVESCEACDAAGWDGARNAACKSCGGHGALAVNRGGEKLSL